MGRLLHFLKIIIGAPFCLLFALIAWIIISTADLAWLVFGRKKLPTDQQPNSTSASVVIPNWNGRDLLEKYLPSVLAAMSDHPDNEVVVVDNGSTDGSADFVRQRFPQVNLVALPENLGFGGGSNAGFRAAKNDIVVLLNSDMRVDRDFLSPLLRGFQDPQTFAVSCQIFFSDPDKLREETGLTQAWWQDGGLRVRHRLDDEVTDLYPCFYGGGGSCAFDRRKFFELGGFDELLAPFYLEDTDLGYLAWKRGWKVLYQPQSIVYHEHRGTIGKKFSPAYIQGVLKKNFLLFCWKNIHEYGKFTSHSLFTAAHSIVTLMAGTSPERSNLRGQARALRQMPGALKSRWRARTLAAITDSEAFLRPLGGYFRDRFVPLTSVPEKPRVLFLSPYAIYPPTHGGGVFMYQTLRELGPRTELHLIALLDYPHERAPHEALAPYCRSMNFMVRLEGKRRGPISLLPHAVIEFSNDDLEWLIHRTIYLREIDVFQIEYTNMAQYAGRFRQLACMLFEHDIYFQSIARGLPFMRQAIQLISARVEYLRALHYELKTLPMLDRVQVCTPANKQYLTQFLPGLASRIDDNYRAGIRTADYRFHTDDREPDTILFLGSFRHMPNQEAIFWFCRNVLPLILERRPNARFVMVGSDPPPRHGLPGPQHAIELRGFVDDIREPLSRYAIFVCPILSGSGVRVKLLEAFAAGIPSVSTRIGAEGLAIEDGQFCALADTPEAFAGKVVKLLEDAAAARAMAERARQEVEARWDMPTITHGLWESYRQTLAAKRQTR